jgi:hypothetical protein
MGVALLAAGAVIAGALGAAACAARALAPPGGGALGGALRALDAYALAHIVHEGASPVKRATALGGYLVRVFFFGTGA